MYKLEVNIHKPMSLKELFKKNFFFDRLKMI